MRIQKNHNSCGLARSGRDLERMARRALFEAAAREWSGTREGLRRAVREAMKPWRKRFGLLVRILRDARFAAAIAAAVLSGGALPAFASPPIPLSNIVAGTGGFVINGIADWDYSGFSVASVGDLNGDGFSDLIVGARGGDPDGDSLAGESYVVFGKANGTAIALSAVAAGTGGYAIKGIDPDDQSGWWVSATGDVNGDALPDLILGAPEADPGGRSGAGESYVVFGKTDGTAVELSNVDSGTGGFVIRGIDASDKSGNTVSGAGDVNGDGRMDLVVGARYANSNAGESYVVFGKADGAAIELSAVAVGTGGFIINGIDANDRSGFSVSGAGDVNGDGLADVVIGAQGAAPGGDAFAGETYVVFGKTSTAAVNLSDIAAGTGGFVINGIDAVDLSGTTVSGGGDVNGDGLSDVMIAAHQANGSRGECYVVFGKTGTSAVELSDVSSGTGGFLISGMAVGDRIGDRGGLNSAGDVNGDGFADVLIGAYKATPDGPVYAGESYVVFGKASGTAIALTTVDSGTGGYVLKGIDTADHSGFSVASAGDVNGDGLQDQIIGARNASPSGVPGAGESYIVFSPESAPASATYLAKTIIGDGAGGAIVPVTELKDARVKINFSDDDAGSASGSASTETVVLTRNDGSIVGLNPATDVANVMWQITTNRTGWTSAEVTLKYTDAETAGMTEGAIRVFHGPTVSGPWTELTTTLDTARNEAKATVTSFSFFALAEAGTVPVELSGFAIE